MAQPSVRCWFSFLVSFSMPEFQEKAVLVRREAITANIIRLTLKAPQISVHARPGQFVMVRIGSGADPLLRRPFSIHQVLADATLQVLFKVVGQGTELLARCQVGETLDCLGPLGRGFTGYDSGQGRRFCLVGGGMGIAPLYFLARRIQQRAQAPEKHVVLLGGRTRDEVALFEEEFLALGCRVHVATDDGSMGYHGLVPDLLPDVLQSRCAVFTCGPLPMMQTVASLAERAACPCQVSLETHMACGLGACLGCALAARNKSGYIHVCKEGPVFDAGEVAWPQ